MDTAGIGMAIVCAGLFALWMWHELVATDHNHLSHKLGMPLQAGETNLHPEL